MVKFGGYVKAGERNHHHAPSVYGSFQHFAPPTADQVNTTRFSDSLLRRLLIGSKGLRVEDLRIHNNVGRHIPNTYFRRI